MERPNLLTVHSREDRSNRLELHGRSVGMGASLVGAALALLAASSGFIASTSSDPTGGNCKFNDFGLLCVNPGGAGTFVGQVYVTMTNKNPLPTCTKEFRLTGVLQNGTPIKQEENAKCGFTSVWVEFQVNRNIRSGSDLCAAVRNAGDSLYNSGMACVPIKG